MGNESQQGTQNDKYSIIGGPLWRFSWTTKYLTRKAYAGDFSLLAWRSEDLELMVTEYTAGFEAAGPGTGIYKTFWTSTAASLDI